MTQLTITNATFSDMSFFTSLANEEGWNPGLHDDAPFFNTDPKGFFIGEIGGEKIGCISSVAYNSDFGFIGFYIVKPQHRGQGFGIQLWNHAIEYLGNRTIGLDGVVAQQDNYRKSHFQLYYKNIRFEGSGNGKDSPSVIDLKNIPLDLLCDYDRPIFGLQRKRFLDNWVHMPNAYSLGKMKNDQLIGYGVIRQCFKGFKIGPLFADTIETGYELFQALCARAGNNPVLLDVPEVNQQAMEIVKNANLSMVFETARMYNKSPPKQLLHKVFGLTSFELG